LNSWKISPITCEPTSINVVHRDLIFTLGWFSDTLSKDESLSLLFYAGYLTITVCCLYPIALSFLIPAQAGGRFKIPNREVISDWVRWVIGDANSWASDRILKTCVEGPVSDFEATWPIFMQQHLHPRLVGMRGTQKTPESVYRVFFLGLMRSLGGIGWEVIVEPRAGVGHIDLCLRRKHEAVLIGLKSSVKKDAMEEDANKALEQMVRKGYRNPEGLPNVRILREYGIAWHGLNSCVKGRYSELNHRIQWVEP